MQRKSRWIASSDFVLVYKLVVNICVISLPQYTQLSKFDTGFWMCRNLGGILQAANIVSSVVIVSLR